MKDQGFTLIELLIAVVIIGILTAIAAPRIANTKDRGYMATMKSDLRNFAAAEESYFYDFAVYTSDLAGLQTRGFQESNAVTLTIAEATASGWSATTAHALSTVECALFIGSAAPVGGATEEGVAICQ